MKKILVTGGAGFLGSNLCEKLLQEQNNYVVALDNLSSGRLKNIEYLLENRQFKFIKHDIINPIDLDVDEIYNAACPASPPYYQMSPTSTTKTCIYGIINMLELAIRHRAKLLQFSTSEVYGDPLEHPQSEGYRGHVNSIGIRSCYDEGKRCAESLCFDYYREFGARIKIIRIFNTYGPNMASDDGRVVSNFIVQALKGQDITIYGDGHQTRSFCYVDDLLDGIVCMMRSDDTFQGPVNLGNPGEFTVLELGKLVLQKLKVESKIIFKELPKDDPLQRKPDISLAKKMLNWSPKIDLEHGLNRTIQYFKQELNS